jgi:NNP family nitrate/nitrite transporter-like MFS transporter
VEDKDEGKALSLHEIAPNLSFVLAPIGAIFALRFLSWRSILLVLAFIGVAAGTAFAIFAKGGRFRGKSPRLADARLIMGKSSFWITAGLFAIGAGAASGLFSMTPTFLVSEREMDPELVNTLVGLSRLSGLIVIFLAGYMVDRFGARRVITVVMLSGGLATAAMSLAYLPLAVTAVFLQAILIACFFPAGFTVISRIAPREMHNLTISFMFPIGYAVGSGLVPLFLGFLGDRLSFATGFLIYGALMAAASVLPSFLRLEAREPQGRGKKPGRR